MSQRNPMNDRYQTDAHQGQTRKSAASMKPKTKAAASVRVVSKTKTRQQKKAEQKAARAKQSEMDRICYNPPTAEYKKLRRVWWALLIAAILCCAVSIAGRSFVPETVGLVVMGMAFVFLMAATYVDSVKIKKLRRAYQIEMMGRKTKEQRAAEKKIKAKELAKREKVEGENPDESELKPTKRGGWLGLNLPFSKREKSKGSESAKDVSKAASNQDESTKKNAPHATSRKS